jgi:arginine repressor
MGKYNSTPRHITEGMCIALCQQKRRRPALTQGELKEWLWTMHGVCVTQATISLTLKRSDELLAMAVDTSVPPPRLALRTHQAVQYMQMELTLKRWFLE